MRLSDNQRACIQRIVGEQLGDDCSIRVYGSRLDEQRRGGDVDILLMVSEHVSLYQRADLKMALEASLQLPVDILIYRTDKPATPFQELAMQQSVLLGKAACEKLSVEPASAGFEREFRAVPRT